VGKAIRRALARITEADPVIGEHLRQAVHTGVRCSYWPGLSAWPGVERGGTRWTAAGMKANYPARPLGRNRGAS
jgi:hypothetical protein